MGVEQLKKLDWFCAARRENFKRWTGGFQKMDIIDQFLSSQARQLLILPQKK
jgi:hypothetical protein